MPLGLPLGTIRGLMGLLFGLKKGGRKERERWGAGEERRSGAREGAMGKGR